MDAAVIWYLTDHDKGKKMADAIGSIGLTLNLISGFNLKQTNINEDEINIIIFDFVETDPAKVLKGIETDQRLQSSVKFIVLKKKEITDVSKLSYNLFHLELLSRPLNKRDFLLLIEKTVVVERYREMMKYISKESEARIEAFEGLININRKNIFESEKEKKVFEGILAYEKNLMKEQGILNDAIEGFTLLRQSEMFDMKKPYKSRRNAL